ncbi:DUF262 domain-containing protein [Cronobacter turicensis]
MAGANKITSSNPRLASLLSDVERGNIKIPAFQREYVWVDEQIMGLLDSIYCGYPVGSLLLWSTKEELKHERNVGGFLLPNVADEYPVSYVLDGQQRLTSLFGVFNSDKPTSDKELAERFNVCFIPSTKEFVHASVAEPHNSINLNIILDTTKLLPEMQKFSIEEQKEIATLTERFKDYEFPIVTIKDRTNQEVCRVFQRINSSGTSLSTLELLSAWTWSEEFNLRHEIEALLDSVAERGYEQLDETLLMRCLTSIVNGGIDSDSLVDVAPATLIQGMSTLKQSLYAAMDFLETELKIKNIVFLPFPIMLVPLVSFFSKNLKPNANQLSMIKKWFWACSFLQRYKAGTNTFVVDDIKTMNSLATDPNMILVFDETKVDVGLFLKTWRINSTAAKASICLLAQLNPKSFVTGRAVDLGQTMSAYNSRQFHHVYPKAHLSKVGIHFHESNVIANICFLTADDNLKITDKSPSIYFNEMDPSIKQMAFDAALIPDSVRDGSKPYSEFLSQRSEALCDTAKKLIRNGVV